MVAAEAADLALDAALLMRPLEPRRRELRREQVVRAQRDEAVGLDPPAALQHLLDRRGQVVEADLREHAAEPLERLDVQLQERLLGLDQRRLTERRARRTTRASRTDAPSCAPRQIDLRLAPVDLRADPRRVRLRHERPAAHQDLPNFWYASAPWLYSRWNHRAGARFRRGGASGTRRRAVRGEAFLAGCPPGAANSSGGWLPSRGTPRRGSGLGTPRVASGCCARRRRTRPACGGARWCRGS